MLTCPYYIINVYMSCSYSQEKFEALVTENEDCQRRYEELTHADVSVCAAFICIHSVSYSSLNRKGLRKN